MDKLRSEGYETLKELLLEKVKDILNEKIIQKARQEPKVEKVRTMEIDEATSSSMPQYVAPSFGRGGKGKGKGKGGGKGKGFGRGKGGEVGGRGHEFKAKIICKFCGRTGHYTDQCFAKKRQDGGKGKVNSRAF